MAFFIIVNTGYYQKHLYCVNFTKLTLSLLYGYPKFNLN